MKIHELKGHIQSIYLVEYDHGLLLLDGASRNDVRLILRYIKGELKRPKEDLKLVVVTHMHPDHAGGACPLREITGCKIAARENINDWYDGLTGIMVKGIDMFLTYYVAYKKEKPFKSIRYSSKLTVDLILEDAKPLEEFEEWKVFFTCGHTHSDVTLFHEGEGVAYVGDNIVLTRRGFVTPFPMHLPQRYKESLAFYKELGIREYLLAHHGQMPIEDSELDRLIDQVKPTPRNYKEFFKTLLKREKW